MSETSIVLIGVLIYFAGLAVTLWIAYYVIRAAVADALREHHDETHRL